MSELAYRDSAFANAQETISGLEKEVEDLNEEIQQEELRNEIARLARAGSKLSGGQPAAETFGNAQHFNIDHDESHAEAIHKSTGRPSAVLSEGAAASSSYDPRPAPTKPFHPTLGGRGQPKDAKPETNAKQSDWGNWDLLDNPAVSHGFPSRAAYEEFLAEVALAACKRLSLRRSRLKTLTQSTGYYLQAEHCS